MTRVKPALRHNCCATPPVLKDHMFLVDKLGATFQIDEFNLLAKTSGLERPQFMAKGMVFQYIRCYGFGKELVISHSSGLIRLILLYALVSGCHLRKFTKLGEP